MTSDGAITKDGEKMKSIHQQLKKLYGTTVWDTKRVCKPYVNIGLLEKELRESPYWETKSADEIIIAIKTLNENYLKTLKNNTNMTLYTKIVKSGGFSLQYKTAKAKWVRELF